MLPDPRGRTRNQSSLRELLVLALCFLMGSYGLLLSIPLALLPLCRRPSALAGAARSAGAHPARSAAQQGPAARGNFPSSLKMGEKVEQESLSEQGEFCKALSAGGSQRAAGGGPCHSRGRDSGPRLSQNKQQLDFC